MNEFQPHFPNTVIANSKKDEILELVEKTQNQETPIEENPSTKGGLKTLPYPFIIVNESFEKVASYGIQPNLILHLMNLSWDSPVMVNGHVSGDETKTL
ncbi:hypothetical protein MKW98_021360 [Papaver atlanticum]|uniref:Uncharacterized protein n=1 Tax=Papaver atlanticum TaxID=357466 RepID=A0AAD4SRM4_9MAGN|nr:hypothetical protein MKW98_021360 [Papaver atlanticum]